MRKIATSLGAISTLMFCKASAALAQAEGLTGAQTDLGTVTGELTGVGQRSLPELVGGIINIVLGLLGVVLIIMIVVGGVMWMTSGGEKDKVTKARKLITDAIIGLIIVVAAYAIAEYVIGALVTAAT
jgi:hypothetical protein